MEKIYLKSTGNFNNIDLNLNSDISCRGIENEGGKVMSGLRIQKKNNKQQIVASSCSGLNTDPNKPLVGLNNTDLNNVCNCSIVNMVNSNITCPKNKYMRTYYPLLGKASCCTPCNDNITVEYDNDNCTDIYGNATDELLKCPEDSYVTGIYLTQNTRKLKCCKPHLSGKLVDKYYEMNKRCDELDISPCSAELITNRKLECSRGGLDVCNEQTLNGFRNKCNKYGMRYEREDGNIINPSSKYICHNDTFAKLDKLCDDRDINDCSIENIDKYYDHKIQKLDTQLQALDNITNNSYSELLTVNNFIWIVLSLILFIIVLNKME
jgi:hypothetical protein